MTLVTIHLTVPDGQVGDPEAPAVGHQQWTPVGPGARRRAESPPREVLPASFRVDLLPGVTTVEVAPTTASWVWLVREYVDGAGTSTRVIAVPDQPTIDYRDCQHVDPASLTVVGAAPDPIWQQQLDALTVEIGAALARSEAAAASANAAASSASAAATSATNAGQAAAAAGQSADTATTAAGTATGAATSATASASDAAGSASSATASKDAAASSASNAATSATNAASSATAAATSASMATTKASEAGTSASTATTKAAEAAASAATVAAQVLIPDPTYPGLYLMGA